MKAMKENKVYTITETEKKGFLDKGYSIVLDDGNVEKPPNAAVPAEEYQKLKAENAKLKEENKKLKAAK